MVLLQFILQDGSSLAHGENFQETARYCYNLNPTQLVAVGVNCTNPAYSESLFQDINRGIEANPIPLIIYPNSGEKYVDGTGSVVIITTIYSSISLFLRWIFSDGLARLNVNQSNRMSQCGWI